MKGIVFTEFLEMVETEFGYEIMDRITSHKELASGGAYTAVGNYPHQDMLKMLESLTREVDIPIDTLVNAFGRYLFRTFTKSYTTFFEGIDDSLEFLYGIETVIHTEVRKLYADANLPMFDCERPHENLLIMHYRSKRPMADLAEGLIQECVKYFGDEVTILREPGATKDSHSAKFTLTRQ